MNNTVAVRDVMAREYVGVSESDAVAGAARLMRDESVDSAIVLRGRTPVGVLAAEDVVALVADGRDPEETTIGDVMTEPVVSLNADDGLEAAVNALTVGDARRVVVTEDGDTVGVVTGHDLLTATSARTAIDVDESVETPMVATAAETEAYSDQSVCERCGSLAADLVEANGQLVCADCREI